MFKPENGLRIQILEDGYCGIQFAKVGDMATIMEEGQILSAFWVKFDSHPDTPCMLLVEHNGLGWQPVRGACAEAAA